MFSFSVIAGSVKVVAEGEESVIDVFFDDLKRIREGVDIETKEISRDADLPVPFSRVAADETLEYMKRFDKGIDLLTDIKTNTGILTSEIKANTGVLTEVKNDLTAIKSDNREIKSNTSHLVEGQNKIVNLLEKIESKLK